MSASASPRSRILALTAAILVAVPPILFYSILFRQALNLPYLDDYEALLDFLNQMEGLNGVSARTSYFLAAQHNEYKLFFEHGLVWLQFALVGHIGLKFLCALGNGFVLLLAILLWKMFLPNQKNIVSRLAFFIPVSWLLFQLQYVETLNWAMASLQNLPVLVFSFGAIYLLVQSTRRAFCGALLLLILAIASSGNGLLMIPIGVLILALAPRYVRVVSWLAVSAGCMGAYAYRYNIMSLQSPIHHSILSAVIRARPLYAMTFIGYAAAVPLRGRYLVFDALICPFLGLVLCVFFVAVARKGYIRRNPTVSYCVLFLLLTTVGVAGLRSDLGIWQSLSSRYGIYSILLLIFAWFAFVEEFLQYERTPFRPRGILSGTVAIAVLFSLGMDVWGWRYNVERNRDLVRGMAAYEHSVSSDPAGPLIPLPLQPARMDELDKRAPVILRQSTRLGIYRPPVY